MSRLTRLQTGLVEMRAMARILPHAPRFAMPSAPWSPSRLLSEQAKRRGDRQAIRYLDRRYTWHDVDREANRTARAFTEMGIGRDDTVALLMDNRPEFVFAIMGLNRIRAAGALINTNITGIALAHAVRIAEPVAVLCGAEHREKLEAVLPEVEDLSKDRVWVQSDAEAEDSDGFEGPFRNFDETLSEQTDEPLPRLSIPRADDVMGLIYTSGTTGLPKAAVIRNQRVMMPGAALGRAIFDLNDRDVMYVTTPLYHAVGMFVGWGSALTVGSSIALRRRFSASNFWSDVKKFDATAFCYIGELCRYLVNQPKHKDERNHRLRVAGGNGLRPDIWEEFQKRFGIPEIREYYGATEGNGMVINFTGRPGMVGRILPGQQLLRCDLETGEPTRNREGRCETISEGETGLFVIRVSPAVPFDGYLDKKATDKKILTGVFSSNDRYFNTGDLLQLHEDGWLSFADRVGDTFRWKGENVSTNEVAEILNGAPGVLESNVYGVEVPGAEGRAGMASLNVDDDFDIDRFAAHVVAQMPGYQRPMFVRVQHEMRLTVTFKHQKVDYRREGFDPSQVEDPLYFLDGDRYAPIDAILHEEICNGTRRL